MHKGMNEEDLWNRTTQLWQLKEKGTEIIHVNFQNQHNSSTKVSGKCGKDGVSSHDLESPGCSLRSQNSILGLVHITVRPLSPVTENKYSIVTLKITNDIKAQLQCLNGRRHCRYTSKQENWCMCKISPKLQKCLGSDKRTTLHWRLIPPPPFAQSYSQERFPSFWSDLKYNWIHFITLLTISRE